VRVQAAVRGVWIDAGDDPHTAKLDPRGIHRAFFAAAVLDPQTFNYVPNPRLNAAYLYGQDGKGGWKAAVGSVGIYRAGNWKVNGRPLTEVEMARQLDADLVRIGADSMQCSVHVNCESHEFDLVGFLREWRALRPHRDTTWVIEGMQGGRINNAMRQAINQDSTLQVMGEAFYDEPGRSMLPHRPDRVRADLIDAGIQRSRCVVMYDAAVLDDHWDGCAFTQGRLP
jgi:hypothetical protein